MSAVLPAAPRPPESVPSVPEPDVTWGTGGIDDWGWTRVEPVGDSATGAGPEPA